MVLAIWPLRPVFSRQDSRILQEREFRVFTFTFFYVCVQIRAVMLLIAGILLGFAAQCILYSALRDRILTSTAGSITLSAFWTYLGSLGCFCLNASIILK